VTGTGRAVPGGRHVDPSATEVVGKIGYAHKHAHAYQQAKHCYKQARLFCALSTNSIDINTVRTVFT